MPHFVKTDAEWKDRSQQGNERRWVSTRCARETSGLLPLFFTLMKFQRITQFKTQHRWLETHPQYRKANRVPERLRRLDTDASWSKSAYHGWVYGYGVHLTCSLAGFPKLVQVETGSVSESQVIDEKEAILN